MATKTYAFDAAELLDSPEAQAEYLSAAMEGGDPAEIRHALGVIARARGMTEVARQAGVSREGLYKALGDDGDPKLSTLIGLIRALGLKLTAEAA
ncbi:putative addiction module antidote protein [Roseomonas gilardii]|uniref:Addiction module antidote protein n=1 Tax=Roseomonas gilardii TaxID=257708 RepID=A0ABU3MBD4_9PROT|nr:addiction module antidote protein [Roseomonas gilardii]MDT8330166.1 putative addiction module antidote protein [Roseomonas gilardii]